MIKLIHLTFLFFLLSCTTQNKEVELILKANVEKENIYLTLIIRNNSDDDKIFESIKYYMIIETVIDEDEEPIRK